jgi:hypothetical protein
LYTALVLGMVGGLVVLGITAAGITLTYGPVVPLGFIDCRGGVLLGGDVHAVSVDRQMVS